MLWFSVQFCQKGTCSLQIHVCIVLTKKSATRPNTLSYWQGVWSVLLNVQSLDSVTAGLDVKILTTNSQERPCGPGAEYMTQAVIEDGDANHGHRFCCGDMECHYIGGKGLFVYRQGVDLTSLFLAFWHLWTQKQCLHCGWKIDHKNLPIDKLITVM